MTLKKFMLPFLLLMGLSVWLPDPVLHAQIVPYAGQTRVSNEWVAGNFGRWQQRVQSGSWVSGTYSVTIQGPGYVTAGGNQSFTPFGTNIRLMIGTGATKEIVTPSSVSGCTVGSVNICTVTATFSFAHGAGTQIVSGSCGFDEAAVVANQNQGGVVLFDGVGGCSNTVITTSAAVFANVNAASMIGDGGWDMFSSNGTVYAVGQLFNTPFLGVCSGTATSSSTLSLDGLGNLVPTCTSTTASGGVTVNIAGTIGTLSVTVGTAPVGASVFTVTDNGSSTTTTCTITGPATSCTDSAHHAATVATHIYAVKFTTNASETLANVKASVTLVSPQ